MLFDQEWQVLRHMPTPVSFDRFQRLAEANRVVDKLDPEQAMDSLTEQRREFQQRRHSDERPVSNQTLNSMAGKLLEGRQQRFMPGKYWQFSLLGKGSMGTAYLAEHTMMCRSLNKFSRRKKSQTFT